MSESTEDESLRLRFTDFVRSFKPVVQKRYAKLLPFNDGIAELRQKGASYRVIREALDALGVKVALDTLGHFCRDMIEQRAPHPRHARRRVRTASDPHGSAARALSESDNVSTAPSAPNPSAPTLPPPTEPLADRPRSRGPRIATSHHTNQRDTL
jgi:hypothetical protein